MPYRIRYSRDALADLRHLTARQQAIILDSVPRHLANEATTPTRNRKRLRPNPLAGWELRIGDLRVYYDVEETPAAVVDVIAIGVKIRDQVFIRGRRSDDV